MNENERPEFIGPDRPDLPGIGNDWQGTSTSSLDDEKKKHNRIACLTVAFVCIVGSFLILATDKSEAAPAPVTTQTVETVAPQVHLQARAGCRFTPRVCSVLDRTKQMWRQLRNGGCGQCDYTSTQLATIQNNNWLNRSLVATSQLRTPHSTGGWNFGDRGVGAKTARAKAINCGAGATPWEFWATHDEPSMFGLSTLYEFHYHADVCFRINSAGNNWNVMSISSDTWLEDRDCVNCSWGGSVLDHRSGIPDTWVQDIRTEKVAITIPTDYGFVNNVDPQAKANIFGPSHWDLIPGY